MSNCIQVRASRLVTGMNGQVDGTRSKEEVVIRTETRPPKFVRLPAITPSFLVDDLAFAQLPSRHNVQ
jgi:hypothetical protein